MTKQQLDEWEKLCHEAQRTDVPLHLQNDNWRKFILASRIAMPQLIAEVRRQHEVIQSLRDQKKRLEDAVQVKK